jgi:ABC-type multidrug transport system ATPase subunit
VGVSLGGRRVLSDVSLDLRSGETLGVAGPNGSGKTTLVRSAATLTTIDRGAAFVLGTNVDSGELTTIRASIGLIGHQPALIPELTLSENLGHIARLARIEFDRVDHALDVVGLSGAADRRASECSFGMLRRIEIAHLLLTKPRLLLLDEAASGLDESARDLIGALIGSVRGRGGAAIIVSHDRAQLEALCDRVLSLEAGRLESVT